MEYYIKINTMLDRINREISILQSQFDTTDLAAVGVRIKNIESDYKFLETECEIYVSGVGGSGSCKTACRPNNILVKNCLCYNSTHVTKFYESLDRFVSLEDQILTYNRKGNKSDLDGFKSRALTIRKTFEQYFSYFYDNHPNYDVVKIQKMNETVSTQTLYLQLNFTSWVTLNNPPPQACAPNCTASEVKDFKICGCMFIMDWDKLLASRKELPGILERIKKLSIDGTNRNNLLSNW